MAFAEIATGISDRKPQRTFPISRCGLFEPLTVIPDIPQNKIVATNEALVGDVRARFFAAGAIGRVVIGFWGVRRGGGLWFS